MTSAEIREELIRALELDLIGPAPGHKHQSEKLPMSPSRWYLTGFLVPYEAPESQRRDAVAEEELDQLTPTPGTDDDERPERASSRKVFLPSSIGMSFLVPASTRKLHIRATWGDYKLAEKEKDAGDSGSSGSGSRVQIWTRTPRLEELEITLPDSTLKPLHKEIPRSDGLRIVTSIRTVPHGAGKSHVPTGTRAVSIFMVNYRPPAPDERKDEALIFQAALTVSSDEPFVARPNVRGLDSDDPDERIADLQYRDVYEYAVGHGVATTATLGPDRECREVSTVWMPTADVEKVEPRPIRDVELKMESLAETATAAEMKSKLNALASSYAKWITEQSAGLKLPEPRKEVADELLRATDFARRRIDSGIHALEDPQVLEAFRIANRTMAVAARQRAFQITGVKPKDVAPPAWRPFQLAFVLMNLRGIAEPLHSEREIVDLLFFPTGGGKTEAYLGLAAYTLVLRRLKNPGLSSAGMSVLMRYTLRLLTLDQLGRAATLICALENERRNDVEKLGTWPFEIGLWVGMAATPNRMGTKGDQKRDTARAKTIAYKNGSRKASPIPLENCPWCGTKFTENSFNLVPNPDTPTDLRVTCVNRDCEFKGNRPLPIVAVDEPLYRRLPCFLIATVDKFASLPWVGPSGMLLGKADRADKDGFYGPCEPNRGSKLPQPLLPPDLIIQDELHLISGPLGTMAGLYEAAIDGLCSRQVDGKRVRPKVIVSTATVRRAQSQIGALFARRRVEVFPPPGPDRRDSFFARTVPATEKAARRYVGIAAQGRSHKVVLLRSYVALLAAAQKAYEREGGHRNKNNPADPYMTLLGYFNSLRELGGSRRIVEDEVRARVHGYASRLRAGESEGTFASREIKHEVLELTSRVKTNDVADAKRRLALEFFRDERVDVALASNMISVGLDITRLGLMVVLGQPKMTSEYIQATSRVGRDDQKPGLVLTLINIHRPRDRSHYERFCCYHESFYRSVEATSVTPFSPRAVDRGIAAVTVTLARHGWNPLTPPLKAEAITVERSNVDFVADAMRQRVEECQLDLSPPELEAARQRMRGRVQDLLDEWAKFSEQKRQNGVHVQYNRTEEGNAVGLLLDPLDPEMANRPGGVDGYKFKAHRSLRGVEPSVNLWAKQLNGTDVEAEEEKE